MNYMMIFVLKLENCDTNERLNLLLNPSELKSGLKGSNKNLLLFIFSFPFFIKFALSESLDAS
jgi:hypothetical protein